MLPYLLNCAPGEVHCVAASLALIGASNFFELAVAAAISILGFKSGVALATVGVLIEVLVMMSVVKIVNRTRPWYKRGPPFGVPSAPSNQMPRSRPHETHSVPEQKHVLR